MGLMGEKLKQNNAKYCISDGFTKKDHPLKNRPSSNLLKLPH